MSNLTSKNPGARESHQPVQTLIYIEIATNIWADDPQTTIFSEVHARPVTRIPAADTIVLHGRSLRPISSPFGLQPLSSFEATRHHSHTMDRPCSISRVDTRTVRIDRRVAFDLSSHPIGIVAVTLEATFEAAHPH
jgi:hypothetical protein